MISILSDNTISYYYHQRAKRYEAINVGTHEDTGIPEHLM